jgi:hypothetical protein
MKIQTSELKSERQWRTATGLNEERFYKRLVGFEKSYLAEYGQPLKERLVKNKRGYCIHNEEELLCGMDMSNVQRNQEIGIRIL